MERYPDSMAVRESRRAHGPRYLMKREIAAPPIIPLSRFLARRGDGIVPVPQGSRRFLRRPSMPASESNVTQLLRDWSAGDKGAFDQLVPLVQAELRRLARRYVARERAGHTLQTSALVNEAYLRLVDQQSVAWKDRAHFLAVAAQVMRHVLVDYARRRGYAKRG